MSTEAQLNSLQVMSPEESERYRNLVGLTGRRLDNPNDLLLEIFSERGYPFEFKPTSVRRGYTVLPSEPFDAFCYDSGARENFKARAAVIRQTPTFRFLSTVTDGEHGNLELIQQIAKGHYADVQEQLPGAEHIGFSPDEMRQSLALAYLQRENFILWGPKKQRTLIEELYPKEGESPEAVEELVQNTWARYADELQRVREIRASLGVEPLSTERIREIVSALVDRTEAFFTGK